MPRNDVVIDTEDGTCEGTLHTPGGTGGWPGVILYPDAGGVRETFRVTADRLAAAGYAVLLPDVYYRAGGYEPFDAATVADDPDEMRRLTELAHSVSAEMHVRDAGAFLGFLESDPRVSGDRVGTTGYCMGGRLALVMAAHYPERVAAAASFHGGGLGGEDDPHSPHRLAGRMRAAVYAAVAENDPFCPAEQVERLERALTDARVEHTVEVYPAAHGFAVPDNPTYDAAADERHWAAVTGFYAAHLKTAVSG
ncbi:dienelactone hydrolase family protein [Pseudonocardia acaciae]|uniref:dienelactone hydrolase family protein n=1 Tax=Pseudonocardia acaciae TaxID=551276 RepID=UPI00048E1401|nr:alpha/beta fold hydrolase [Pseudonocardia acaciae]